MTKLAWIAVICCLAGSGCTAVHNLAFDLSMCKDELVEKIRNRRLAEDAWRQYVGTHREHSPTGDFAKGFKEGFADYLYAGGSEHAPVVPPIHYWKQKYRSPEGYFAIEEWTAGFREGTVAARASGLREWATLPSLTSPRTMETVPIVDVADHPQWRLKKQDIEVLPPPREISP